MTDLPFLATRLSRLAFGVACAIGLVGAWIGLGYHSLWFDELAGAATVGDASSLAATLQKVVTDTTPPVYYIALFGFVKLFGGSDVALRAFSALLACVSILVFVGGTRRTYSLSARLFAGAMATGSFFWFFQAQNARFYTLCLALGAVVLVSALGILRAPPQSAQWRGFAGLTVVLLIGAFTHYYFTIEGLAVMGVLFLFRPRERLACCAVGALLVASTLLYLRFVAVPNMQVDPNNFYIPNTLTWYVSSVRSAVHNTLGRKGMLAAALCLAAIAAGFLFVKKRAPLSPDSADLLVFGVPLLVLAGGVTSSMLLSPSFTDRNLLLCSPFLWAVWARLYDWATRSVSGLGAACFDVALALVVLWMASIALLRTSPKESPYLWSEPFRQSAEWIRQQPACRGAVIPVIDFDRKGWYRGDYDQRLFSAIYGRYLQGYASIRIVYAEDVEAGRIEPSIAEEIRSRLDGDGCPVAAWSVHGVYLDSIPHMKAALLAAVGRQALPDDRLVTENFKDGWWGFVFAARGRAK